MSRNLTINPSTFLLNDVIITFHKESVTLLWRQRGIPSRSLFNLLFEYLCNFWTAFRFSAKKHETSFLIVSTFVFFRILSNNSSAQQATRLNTTADTTVSIPEDSDEQQEVIEVQILPQVRYDFRGYSYSTCLQTCETVRQQRITQ